MATTPPMSESLGMPAGMAPGSSQDQTQPQAQPAQPPPPPPEPPTHHHVLAGVLAAIAGPPPPVHQIDPATGQMQTLPGKDSPGDAFRRILSGALIGMGAGAAAGQGRPGAGILGGIGAGGSAVIGQRQAQNQQDIENQQKNFDEQQKAMLNKATIAHLNAEGASLKWQSARYQAEANENTQKMAFELGEKMAENPNNKDYGTYSSWEDFLQKHPEIAPDTAQQQGGGNLIHHTVYGPDGQIEGVHVYKYDPGWMNQTNAEPFTFSVPGGPGQEDRTFTVPAHSMKMADIWKSATSLEAQELKSAIPKTDMDRYVNDYLEARHLPNTAANRIAAEGSYQTMTKVTPAVTINEIKQEGKPVYAYDPKTDQTVLTTQEKASAGGMQAIREVKESDLRNDSHDIRVLNDVALKSNNVVAAANAMDATSWTDTAAAARYLSDHPNTTVDQLTKSGVLGAMSPKAQAYTLAVLNLRESAMGLSKTLTGSARSNETQLRALMNTLPGVEPNSAIVREKLRQFTQNVGVLRQGLPQIPGMPTIPLNVEQGGGGGGGTTPAAPAPTTHVFSKSGWAAANPGKDVNAAAKQATAQGYEVQP